MRWAILVIVSLLFIVLVIIVLLLYPVVQTWIAGFLSNKLSKDLGITVRIERVEIRPFAMNRLHGVFIADLNGDTLLAVDELRIRGLRIDAKEQRIQVRRLELHDTRFALGKAQGDAHSNLTNLLEKLASEDTTSGGADWKIRCNELDIQRLHFSFHDANVEPLPFGVDFDHVDVNTADIIGQNVGIAGDSVLVDLERISLRDRSGLVLEELSGATQVSPRGIRIAGMRIRTPGTELNGSLKFDSESFADFDDFENKVRMRVDLDSSHVEFADVALFAPDLQGIEFLIGLKGKFRGTISDLKGREMELQFGERSHFGGNVEMTGLPDVPNTFMVIDVDHFNTDPQDLAALPVPPFIEMGRLSLPVEVERMGAISFTGNFTGFPRAFTASGQAFSAAGPLSTDLTYERDTVSNVFELRGSVATTGFDLGLVIGDPTVGNIACDVKVKGSGRSFAAMTAELEGTVPELHVQKLNVGGIALKGRLEKNLFNGVLHCEDPDLALHFDGLADLRGKWPKVDFTADIAHFNPRAFGLIGGEGFSGLTMRVQAAGELAPDSLKGFIHMQDVSYCQDSVDLHLGDIDLTSARESGQALLTLRSTVADLDVRGPFFPTRLPGAVKSVLFSVFPALQDEVRYTQEDQRFSFAVTVKQAKPVLELVAPGLLVDSGSVISGQFDSRTFDLNLNAMLPSISFGAFSGDSVEVILDKTMDVLAFRFRSARQAVGAGTFISGIELTGKAYQDEVQFRAGWKGSNNGTAGDLDLDALVLNDHSVSIDLRPSTLFFGRGSWANERTAHLLIDTSSIHIDSLELRNEGQYVFLDGDIREDTTAALSFALGDVRLENAAPFYEGPRFHGHISGEGRVFSLYKHPYLLSHLRVDSLAVDEHPIGNLDFNAAWNNARDVIDLRGDLSRDTLKMLGFTGVLAPGKKDQELDVDLLLDRFDLRFIEPYLPEAISQVQGKVTGKVDITGPLSAPQANGEVMLDHAGIRINYLNTKYTFSHPLIIRPDQFVMDNVTLLDGQGGRAKARSFSLNHESFSRWNFDVAAELDNLLVLNTTINENQLFYGTAVGSGDLNVDGYTENLGITVDAHTEKGTFLHFPLGASTDVGGLSFVRFVKAGQNRDSLEAPVDLSGVRLDMKIGVTPDARFELIFDPTVGDIISGSGVGDIAMTVTPSGDFSMMGGLEILEGDYLFTLRNLVNKKFTVDPGGRITWYGDPFDARLDMNAVYKLKTALYDIIPPAERSELYRKRVPVEVIMHLSDKLMQPEIGFDVRLPSVDEGVRTQVNTVLSDKDKLNRQVFALVVLNKFIADDANGGGFGQDAGASGATTMAEFASSQLSNLIGRISDDVDLGINYRPGNSIASDEFEVAVGKAFFNNRVQVSTNVGVTAGNSSSSQNGAQFIGDFNVEYLITNDGKLRVKGFSQSNDRNLNQLNQAQTTQGGGLAYSREFNIVGFWRRFMNTFRPPDRKRPMED